MTNIRPAAVAGSWYPGTAPALAAAVDRPSRATPTATRRRCPGDLVALIAPHAGLMYSGPGRRARLSAAARPRRSTSPCSSGRRISSASTACRSIRQAASRRRSASRRSTTTCARAIAGATPVVVEHRGRARARALARDAAAVSRSGSRPALPIVPLVMGYQTAADRVRARRRARDGAPRPPRAARRQHRSVALSRRGDGGGARRGRHRLRVALRRRRPAARARRPAGSRVRRRADGRRHARRAARSARATPSSSSTRIPATSRATSRRWSATWRRRSVRF